MPHASVLAGSRGAVGGVPRPTRRFVTSRGAPGSQVNCAWHAAYDPTAMVKADLINRVMDAASVEGSVARRAVEALLESLGAALERADRVVLRRFGLFHTAPRKTGVARKVRTGEPVGIPRGRVVRFRPAADLRNFPGTG